MKANLATWFVSLQWQETCACNSLGFRGKVKNCKAKMHIFA